MSDQSQSEPVLVLRRRPRQPTVVKPVELCTVGEAIAYYQAMPESVKDSFRRPYRLLIDSGVKLEFDT